MAHNPIKQGHDEATSNDTTLTNYLSREDLLAKVEGKSTKPKQSVSKRQREDLPDNTAPPTKKRQLGESPPVIDLFAFHVIAFLCRGISVMPPALRAVLKSTGGNQPSYETMAQDKIPFNLPDLCKSLEEQLLPLLQSAKEVVSLISDHILTHPHEEMTESEKRKIRDFYIQIYPPTVLDTILDTTDRIGPTGSIPRDISSYLFVAGLLVHKLSVTVKPQCDGSSQPTSHIREATHALWEAFMKLRHQSFTFVQSSEHSRYKAGVISASLLQQLLEDQSCLGKLDVHDVKDAIKNGFFVRNIILPPSHQ